MHISYIFITISFFFSKAFADRYNTFFSLRACRCEFNGHPVQFSSIKRINETRRKGCITVSLNEISLNESPNPTNRRNDRSDAEIFVGKCGTNLTFAARSMNGSMRLDPFEPFVSKKNPTKLRCAFFELGEQVRQLRCLKFSIFFISICLLTIIIFRWENFYCMILVYREETGLCASWKDTERRRVN